ncbi:MAG: N-acetyltransferase, partial [Bacteroidaceae bacterium]|nr:N-acetyltransferase [Bacteroidaceae bacterium]
MAITIKKVASKKDLKTFIRFNYTLYKDVPYAVPELYEDMVDTLTPGRNPALEFCEFACFLAL